MALASGRRLWIPAFFSLALWVVIWLIAVATGLSGAPFWYLLLGIAEPFVFALVMLAPGESAAWALASLVAVGASGLANVVQFVLRLFTVSRPLDISELWLIIFLFLNGAAVVLYIWYFVAAYRNWTAESERTPTAYDKSSDSESTPASGQLRHRFGY